MPLTLPSAMGAGACRSFARAPPLLNSVHHPPASAHQTRLSQRLWIANHFSRILRRSICRTSLLNSPAANSITQRSDRDSHMNPSVGDPLRHLSSGLMPEEELWESHLDMFSHNLGVGSSLVSGEGYKELDDVLQPARRRIKRHSERNLSRTQIKTERQSGPSLVMNSLWDPVRSLYGGIKRAAYTDAVSQVARPAAEAKTRPLEAGECATRADVPISKCSILARYLQACRGSHTPQFQLSARELALLGKEGYGIGDVERWASCILTRSSSDAVQIFKLEPSHNPPIFMVLLFLRRRKLTKSALDTVMRHVLLRAEQLQIDQWDIFELIVEILLRHARELCPESIPWITALYTREATKLWERVTTSQQFKPLFVSSLTHSCNRLLSLLSMPVSHGPFISSHYQETAQFEVLRFMAKLSPELVVTRTGFRAISKIQLGHAKTSQESDWAELKGPAWPPWKEDKTAWDEDKGYESGLSRASQILGRMYEAGYGARKWESIVQMYAGWDTDLSPTIQTRTLLPELAPSDPPQERDEIILWAARVRVTRTRREAWACFLAYEASGLPAHYQVYQAMFEKLTSSEVGTANTSQSHPSTEIQPFYSSKAVLPGDVKEVWPDSKDVLNLIYLSEPLPTYPQLYQRMKLKGVIPKNRLLALLLDTCMELPMALQLLDLTQATPAAQLPGYMIASIIRVLCRFGTWSTAPTMEPIAIVESEHQERLHTSEEYRLDYAYALLMQLQPAYRPAWTAYMRQILLINWSRRTAQAEIEQEQGLVKYRILCHLVERMRAIELDPDDNQLQLLSVAARRAAHSALQGHLSPPDARYLFSTAPRRLRTLFHDLVNPHHDLSPSTPDTTSLPSPVPGPATLHLYVRALGTLRDYEGLYSFSTWARSHHAAILTRAKQQRSGPRNLRKALVALRAALEGALEQGQEPAPTELVALVKAEIDGADGFGGWPSDKEVRLYMQA